MITVLVVEDDFTKYGRVHAALIQAGLSNDNIHHSITAADAVAKLEQRRFDLMLLDVNIPRRLGEGPTRGAAVGLLTDIRRDAKVRLPRYVVGITAFEDVIVEFGERFLDNLWTLILYTDNSDQWISQIAAKVDYINAVKLSDNFSDGHTYGTDLAIVCALEDVEFRSVKRLECGWQPLRLEHDETRYLTGSIRRDGRTFSVIAGAAPRMGMPASAILTAKMIAQFRPRFVAMVGICAGRFGKTNLGDVIVADPCWDWGSGKIGSKNDEPHFSPAPHQVELDPDLRAILKETCLDVSLLAEVKDAARGLKPPSELRVHFAPLASGAAVVANKGVFDTVLDQHRNLLGIEMEAYGVVTACKGSGRPRPTAIIMKSVCDFADKDKADDYQEYAAETSALVLYNAAKVFL